MAHNPGDQICGRFELVRVEPEGTGSPLFGQAWAALDSESGELVRLAIIEPALLADEAARDALIARLQPLSEGGQEDSLVPLSFIGRDGEHVIAAFEALYAGISLADVLADLDAEDRLPELGRVITDVALGLALLHGRGVLHGALGIETIFVWERGNALWQHGLVESCDPAAIAARIAEAGLAVAPEVAETGQVSAASDVFAWGATIAAYISGKPGAEAVEALRAGELLSESGKLLGLLQAAVDPSPAKRPRSGGEVVMGLRDAGLLAVAGEEEGIDDEVLMALAEAGLETISVEALPPEVDAPPPSAKAAPMSEVKAPEVKAPEVKAPEAKAPEAKAPEVKAPEVKAPEVKAPEVKAPEVKAPEVKAPPGTPAPVVPPASARTPAPPVSPPSLGSRGTSKPASIPAPPKFELPKPRSRPHSSSAGAAKLPKLPSLPSLPSLGGKPASAPAIPPLPTAGQAKPEMMPPLPVAGDAQPEVAPPLPIAVETQPEVAPPLPSGGETKPEVAPLLPSGGETKPEETKPEVAPPLPVPGEPEPASEPEPAPDSAIGDAVAAALGGGPISDLPPPYLPPIGAAKEAAPSPVPPSAPRPAAVVVKGKRRDDAGDSKTRAKVHLLEPSGARPVGDMRSAETSGIKTAALVNMALAGGRTTPSGLRAVDARLPAEPSGLRSAVAAATAAVPESSDLSAAVAAATTPSPAALDDVPSPPTERRDRRTHPLGWSVEDIESQAPTSRPDESSPGEAGPDDSVEARAIVEATTVDQQPGAEEKKKDEDSRSVIILLALAAAVLIAYIFVASG